MIRTCLRALWAVVAVVILAWPVAVLAQDVDAPAEAQVFGPSLPQIIPTGPDYAAWRRVSARGERMMETQIASNFAFDRLRAELVIWRDEFSGAQSQNAARLSTIDLQIAALGPAADAGGSDDPAIAARRGDLAAMRGRLATPGLLAFEAHAGANGMIGEVDILIRERKAASLMVRQASPLNPQVWPDAFASFGAGVRVVVIETIAGFRADLSNGKLWPNLLRAFPLLIAGLLLLLRGRIWITGVQMRVMARDQNSVWGFVLSLGQIVLPIVGLTLMTLGLDISDIFGLRSSFLIVTLALMGTIVVLGRWLAGQFFPADPNFGPLGYDSLTRNEARRITLLLTWALAVILPLGAILESSSEDEVTRAAAQLPLQIIAGLLLYRLGVLLMRPPAHDAPGAATPGRLRRILGQSCCVIGIAAPVLSALGYHAAASFMFLPAVVTLAILGVVILLQRLIFDVYGLWGAVPERGTRALMPVLLGFGLLILALPLVALIWGARISDLAEMWTRFVDGFSIGDAHISPSNFLTFALVFVVGYLLTRVIQGTLRASVLPRTRLDLGGQNAIVAGFGYVGIILAAIIAITTAGIDLSNLAIVAGALSVGIGFGLQNIVSNFVAGIILLIERPISEGDWIEVGGQMGYVRSISVRATQIETFDRTDVIIPNADLVSGQVTNWTRGNLVGRVIVPVGVAYGSDTARIEEILQEIAEAHPMVLLSTPPAVIFQGFGESSLDFEIRAILRDVNFVLTVKSEMNHAIAERFAKEGIEIPFAQRDLWLRNPEVLQGASKNE